MTHESLLNDLWQSALARLGGDAAVEASAREKGAFARARGVASAADLLRLVLGYCLGGMGLRSTSAWAASVGLADLSNVALLKRLRKCGPWMEDLAGLLLSGGAQPAAQGRRIRLVDGTTVLKAGREAKKNNGLWRLHCAFDLPAERFSFIELTDEKGGERLDRVPFAKGDIAIADRGYMHPDPLAHVLEQGADIIVRTPWRGARWYGKNGRPFDLLAALAAGETAGVIDRRIWILPKKAAPLPLRLVALRKPKQAAEASREKAAGCREIGRPRHLRRHAHRGRMGYSRHLARCKSLPGNKSRRALPRPLAHRDGVQAPEKLDWTLCPAKRRPPDRQNLDFGSSPDASSARAAYGRA
jgi:hypothetical protein